MSVYNGLQGFRIIKFQRIEEGAAEYLVKDMAKAVTDFLLPKVKLHLMKPEDVIVSSKLVKKKREKSNDMKDN